MQLGDLCRFVSLSVWDFSFYLGGVGAFYMSVPKGLIDE